MRLGTRAFVAAAAVLFAAALLIGATVLAQTRTTSNKDRRFFSSRDGIGLEAPNGWTMSTHTGYPTVLVAFVHPSGARISLAVAQTKLSTASALADESRPGLVAQGFTVEPNVPGPRGSVRVDARTRQKQFVRQLYMVREIPGARTRQAVVVSLSAPAEQMTSVATAFDWAIAHLTLETPTRSDTGSGPDAGA
jgi:hypothetical protein